MVMHNVPERALILAICSLPLLAGLAMPAAGAGSLAAISEIENVVRYRVAERDEWGPAVIGTPLYAGDWTETKARSRAVIAYKDGSLLRLASSCLLQHVQPENRLMKLLLGKIWAKVTRGSGRMRIITPSAQAVIVGTEFVLEVMSDQSTRLTVIEGSILLFPPNVNVETAVDAGEQPGQPGGGTPAQQPVRVNAGQGAVARPDTRLSQPFSVDLGVVRSQESVVLPPTAVLATPTLDTKAIVAPRTPAEAPAAVQMQNQVNDPKILQGSPTTGDVRVIIK